MDYRRIHLKIKETFRARYSGLAMRVPFFFGVGTFLGSEGKNWREFVECTRVTKGRTGELHSKSYHDRNFVLEDLEAASYLESLRGDRQKMAFV